MTPPKPDPNAVKLPFNPCPFCGNYPEYCLNFSKNLIELACRECNARFALFIEAKYFETNGKDFLSTRWNRRAPSVEEELDAMPDWETMYRECEAEAGSEIESLRKKLEVARENFDRISSCENIEIKRIATTALAQLSESKEEPKNLWCAYCGAYGDHQIGSCSKMLKDQQALRDKMDAEGIKETYYVIKSCLIEEPVKEIKELQSQVEKLTKDIIYYRDLWMKRINSDDAIEEERDQLLAEQSRLKERLGFIYDRICGIGLYPSCTTPFKDGFNDCYHRVLEVLEQSKQLSTPPSQEQTPSTAMQSMYEALKKTLEHLHPYNTPEVTIDRIVEAMRLYESMGLSQEQSKEVTAEQALEWLAGSNKTFTWIKTSNDSVELWSYYKDEMLGMGTTPLQAVINAMAKEKESK